MPHEGSQITDVCQLSKEDVSILGYFSSGRESILGLQIETGEVIFPSGDFEGNCAGRWDRTREELKELVGEYIVCFRNPNTGSEIEASKDPIQMIVSPEEPTIAEDGKIFLPNNRRAVTPYGKGVGPSAWFVRDASVEGPPAEETPTPSEVLEMYSSGEISQERYSGLIEDAEKAHKNVMFYTIV